MSETSTVTGITNIDNSGGKNKFEFLFPGKGKIKPKNIKDEKKISNKKNTYKNYLNERNNSKNKSKHKQIDFMKNFLTSNQINSEL